jgi:site-specific recombinase XerD
MSYTHHGRQVRKSTGCTNKKIAEQIYCKVQTQIVEGMYFENASGKNKTLSNMFSRYLEEVSPGKNPITQGDEKRFSRNYLAFFGNCKLNEITSDLVSQYMFQRRKSVKAGTVNRELAFLSTTFNQAIKVWGWCRDNPVSRVKREKEQKRVKYFPDKEFVEIFTLLPEWVKPIVLLGKNTGLRLSNLTQLIWSDINLNKRMIILSGEKMKNSYPLGIPLNKQATSVLMEHFRKRKLHVPYVFFNREEKTYTKWGVYRAFKKACRKAGYPDYRFHDLRHDFCSKLVQSGVDIYTVKELAGHKDVTTTQRYAHLNTKRLEEGVSVLDKTIIVLS